MWLLTETGFVSIVQDRDDHAVLQVRARVPQDIEETFPGAEVITTPGSDYRYRARVKPPRGGRRRTRRDHAVDICQPLQRRRHRVEPAELRAIQRVLLGLVGVGADAGLRAVRAGAEATADAVERRPG